MQMKYKIIIGILSFFLIFMYLSNDLILVKSYHFSGLDEEIKIVHLSDTHNKEFGINNKPLYRKIKKANPDIILLTGDIVSYYKLDLDYIKVLCEDLVAIAPTYYVTGNHEYLTDHIEEIKETIIDSGVYLLSNEVAHIDLLNTDLYIGGIEDSTFSNETVIRETLLELENKDGYKILLAHQPEDKNIFDDYDIDLIFSGHAHGGQFDIPFIGGLYAPDQGIMPELTSGKVDNMIISRGLGNSIFPFRLFNNPEIIIVTIS